MRKTKYYLSAITLFIVMLAILSIMPAARNSIRGAASSAVAALLQRAGLDQRGQLALAEKEELQRLRLESQLIHNEIVRIRDIFFHELYLSSQYFELKKYKKVEEQLAPIIQTHKIDLLKIFHLQMQNLPARVIFRPAGLWNSTFWINVGSEDNKELGKEVVEKNSPVLYGNHVIGVVDYIEKKQSRVRLLTDSGLTPSVRAAREAEGKTRYLAKGELQGTGKILWRQKKGILKGFGFNYDFPDEEGPARDLRDGRPLDGSSDEQIELVRAGDALISTGMDGVFPKGLLMGEVTKVFPLNEGDYHYELEAKPAIDNIFHLDTVFVIPPLSASDE